MGTCLLAPPVGVANLNDQLDPTRPTVLPMLAPEALVDYEGSARTCIRSRAQLGGGAPLILATDLIGSGRSCKSLSPSTCHPLPDGAPVVMKANRRGRSGLVLSATSRFREPCRRNAARAPQRRAARSRQAEQRPRHRIGHQRHEVRRDQAALVVNRASRRSGITLRRSSSPDRARSEEGEKARTRLLAHVDEHRNPRSRATVGQMLGRHALLRSGLTARSQYAAPVRAVPARLGWRRVRRVRRCHPML